MAISKELWVAYTRIFFVELAYWVISIGMVFVNEFILSTNLLTDDLTVFITQFQILFSLGILITLNFITKEYLTPECKTVAGNYGDDSSITVNTKLIQNDGLDQNENIQDPSNHRSSQAPTYKQKLPDNSDSIMQLFTVDIPHRINLGTCKIVFPLSVLYIGMLLLNNFCLKNVGVAFYFVSRSLTTVFNVAFTYFLMNEPVSRGALLCCAFIVSGFILGIDQESVIGSLSVIGVFFGVASSLFTSLFSIYTKKTLAKLDKNIWVLILYDNINAIILCTPLLIIHGDVQSLISEKVVSPSFWFLLSISGVMAFFISIATNASIKYTSPLTHNISGTAKACFQTVIAVIYSHEHKSSLWWISNITILVASAAYSRIKQMEMEQKANCSSQDNVKRCPSDVVNPLQMKLEDRAYRHDSSPSSDSTDNEEVYFEVHNRDTCSVKLQGPDQVHT